MFTPYHVILFLFIIILINITFIYTLLKYIEISFSRLNILISQVFHFLIILKYFTLFDPHSSSSLTFGASPSAGSVHWSEYLSLRAFFTLSASSTNALNRSTLSRLEFKFFSEISSSSKRLEAKSFLATSGKEKPFLKTRLVVILILSRVSYGTLSVSARSFLRDTASSKSFSVRVLLNLLKASFKLSFFLVNFPSLTFCYFWVRAYFFSSSSGMP